MTENTTPEHAVDDGEPAHARSVRRVVASAFRPTLPVVLAQAARAFQYQDLEVTVVTARSSDEQLAQLRAGEIDVAHTALDNVVAWSQIDSVRVIGLVDLGVAHELVARVPIADVSELRGAVIGVDSPRNGLVALLRSMLRDAGLDDRGFELRAAGGLSRRAQAFEAGEIDACLLAGRYLDDARAAGHRSLLALADGFPDYPAIALIARASALAADRDALTRYLAALHAAMRSAADTPTSLARVAELLGTSPDSAAAWVRSERARMTGIVTTREQARQVIAKALADTGRIACGADVGRFAELLMNRCSA